MAPRKNPRSSKPKPNNGRGDFAEESNQGRSRKNDSFFVKPGKSRKTGGRFPNKKEKHVKKDNLDCVEAKPPKKPFDKKAWRLKKYSNKHKVQQWENRRNQAVLQGYHKIMKKDNSRKFDVEKIYKEYETEENTFESDATEETIDTNPQEHSKGSKRKQKIVENAPEDAQSRKQEALRKRALKEEAIKEYKRKKSEKYKKLNQKTKKGQPVMKGRIEILLEEIQQSMAN